MSQNDFLESRETTPFLTKQERNAASIAADEICSSLNESGISCDSVDIQNQLLEVSFTSEGTDGCTVETVNDASGACLYYMTGDFVYGNLSSWVSPQAEETFLEEEAPPDRETQ